MTAFKLGANSGRRYRALARKSLAGPHKGSTNSNRVNESVSAKGQLFQGPDLILAIFARAATCDPTWAEIFYQFFEALWISQAGKHQPDERVESHFQRVQEIRGGNNQKQDKEDEKRDKSSLRGDFRKPGTTNKLNLGNRAGIPPNKNGVESLIDMNRGFPPKEKR